VPETGGETGNTEVSAFKGADDPLALVQFVLRESYLETTEDLRAYAEKVRYFNECKKAVRRYLTALREFKASVLSAARERGVDLCRANENDLEVLARTFEEHARPYDLGEVDYELCIPDRVPPAAVKSGDVLENEIKHWEERLTSLGDDAQLANVDLQNILQKQQQTLQMLSNISKMLHDTAMGVIRKIGG
jgi:hypothetical protein